MDKTCKRTLNLIGALMIIQFCLWFAASFVYGIASAYLSAKLAPIHAEVCDELVFALLYTLSFGVPILIGKHFIKSEERVSFDVRTGVFTVPMICASLGVIFAAAIVNNLITLPFDSVGLDAYTPDMTMTVTPATFLANLLSLVILPAFLEELLFRGVILGALLPYGKGSAIIVSALLFAMMHQNPKQFVYAFAAGAVIGYFVCETRSLFMGVLIHGVNNLISLINMSVMNACDERTTAAYSLSLYFAVFALALVSVPVIIGRKKKDVNEPQKSDLRLRDFFTPAMIIYFVISVLYFVFMITF